MSKENVDRFVITIEAFNRTDMASVLAILDPEVRFEHRLAALQGDLVGPEAVKGWFTDLFEHFTDAQIQCPDIRDLGDRVLALGTVRAIGAGSRVETELPYTVVASFRNGLITHFIDYGDRGKALEAAGLSE